MVRQRQYAEFLALEYRLNVAGDNKSGKLGIHINNAKDLPPYIPAVEGLGELSKTIDGLVRGVQGNYPNTRIGVSLNNYEVQILVQSDGDQIVLYDFLKTLFKNAGVPFFIIGSYWFKEIAERVLNREFNKTMEWKKSTKAPAGYLLGFKIKPAKGRVLDLNQLLGQKR